MKVLVTGGTGTLGSAFVGRAAAAGHAVRILSRRTPPSDRNGEEWVRADLTSGDDLTGAVDGIDAVMHAATSPGLNARKVDVEGTRRLIAASEAAGVDHIIYPSIVGIDEIPFSYYRYKLEAEQIIAAGDVPHTILRAAQFHEFVDQIISAAMRLPLVALLPTDFQMQSVAASEVAARLLRCLEEPPSGRLPDFAGPELRRVGEMAHLWMDARQKRKRLIRLPLPGRTARAFREGKNTKPDRREGDITWQGWLEDHPA